MAARNAPSSTIYINNLNSSLVKADLKSHLYNVFQSYGPIHSITALKTPRMRGQAWIAFADPAVASHALTSEDARLFFGKAMRINYAKTVSKATLIKNNPDAMYEAASTSRLTVSSAQREHQGKRALEDIAALAGTGVGKKAKLTDQDTPAVPEVDTEDENDVAMEEDDNQEDSTKRN